MVSGDLRPSAKQYIEKISQYQSYMAQAAQLSKDSKYEDAPQRSPMQLTRKRTVPVTLGQKNCEWS